MTGQDDRVSSSEADRAGQRLRYWFEGRGPLDSNDLHVIKEFRSGNRYPLKLVTVGIRQFVERESTAVHVTQRLKRLQAILDKLKREAPMRLSQMQDIGGCRAVLPGGQPEIEGVIRRIHRNNWEVHHEVDYSRAPTETGYRAVHIVVRREGRLVEIQLRTPLQDHWANVLEQTDGRLDTDLKHGDGPVVLREYFRKAAEMLAAEERGEDLSDQFYREFEELREAAQPLFIAGSAV